MAQIHKGARTQVSPRLPLEIRRWAQSEADRIGVCLSAYIADLMAVAVGRRDLVREVSVGELPCVSLAVPRQRTHRIDPTWPFTGVRLAKPVADEIRRLGTLHTFNSVPTPPTTYITYTLAAAMHAPRFGDVDDSAVLQPSLAMPVQGVLLAV